MKVSKEKVEKIQKRYVTLRDDSKLVCVTDCYPTGEEQLACGYSSKSECLCLRHIDKVKFVSREVAINLKAGDDPDKPRSSEEDELFIIGEVHRMIVNGKVQTLIHSTEKLPAHLYDSCVVKIKLEAKY